MDANHNFDMTGNYFEDIFLDHFLLAENWFENNLGLQCEGDNGLSIHKS
jgi:hypothetical protein